MSPENVFPRTSTFSLIVSQKMIDFQNAETSFFGLPLFFDLVKPHLEPKTCSHRCLWFEFGFGICFNGPAEKNTLLSISNVWLVGVTVC